MNFLYNNKTVQIFCFIWKVHLQKYKRIIKVIILFGVIDLSGFQKDLKSNLILSAHHNVGESNISV